MGRSRVHPIWLFPATYILHLCEEYFIAGGFPLWAERSLGLQLSGAEFVAWNAFAFALMCVGAWLVSRDARFQFIEIALAVAVLGNVLAHVFGSLATRTYSPGLLTALGLWIPAGVSTLQRVWAVSARKARIAGVCIGLSIVFVTMAVVAARAALSLGAGRCDGQNRLMACFPKIRAQPGAGERRAAHASSEFLRTPGERLLGRDTVVMIWSDGLDVGDRELRRDAILHLVRPGRLTLLWLNPCSTHPDTSTAIGMRLARPFVIPACVSDSDDEP